MFVDLSITVLASGFVFTQRDCKSQAFLMGSDYGIRLPSCRQIMKSARKDFGAKMDDFEISKVNNRHSASDWLYNMGTLPKSSVLREIRNPILSIMAWSALISLMHQFLINCTSPYLRNIALNMRIGTQIHSLLVSSLGLLLVFRTNSAYQRFTVCRFQLTVIVSQLLLYTYIYWIQSLGGPKDLGTNTIQYS